MGYYQQWAPYVPVAERRKKAAAAMKKRAKKGLLVEPVVIEGRAIARSAWGKRWCDALEAQADFATFAALTVEAATTRFGNGSAEHRAIADAWAQVKPIDPLWLGAHADAGFENTTFGTSSWAAGALYAQAQVASYLYLAARGDYFHEHAASNGKGTASRLFWPGDWVASGTGTVDFRPIDNLSVRLEYRHDQAATDTFFKSAVTGDGSAAAPFVPNARSQDTLTLGATTWL